MVLYQAKVKTSGVTLNVRANSSTQAKVVGKLKNGSVVNVHEAGRDWCRISQNGIEGWSSSAYLVPIDGTGTLEPVTHSEEPTHQATEYVTMEAFQALMERVKRLEAEYDYGD